MKPFLSLFAVIIFFQSLLLGSLVKLDLQKDIAYTLQETLIQKPAILDPFLVPDNSAAYVNLLSKNEWVPFHFMGKYHVQNVLSVPEIILMSSQPDNRLIYPDIPVFLFQGNLRL